MKFQVAFCRADEQLQNTSDVGPYHKIVNGKTVNVLWPCIITNRIDGCVIGKVLGYKLDPDGYREYKLSDFNVLDKGHKFTKVGGLRTNNYYFSEVVDYEAESIEELTDVLLEWRYE